MTLTNLLEVLEGNMNLMLTIVDGNPVITFDAAGASAISSELGLREVDRIGVETAEHFNIYLKAVVNDEVPTDDNP